MATAEPFTSLDDFNVAVTTATEAAAAYYDTDTLKLTDAEYDALISRIEASVAANPNWDAEELLNAVAAGTSAGGDVVHTIAMLSLAKVTEESELADFLTRISGTETVTEVKLDGMAIKAVYEKGNLVIAATRGDGATGENVIAQAQNIAGLPLTVPTLTDLEVRGEVYMSETDFETASTNRVAAGKKAFVNPRNATAGTLRNADLTYEAPLSFAAYDAYGPEVENLPTHTSRMAHLTSLGFSTAIALLPNLNATDDAATMIEKIGEERPTLGFPIDGAVVKVNDIATREKFGAISRTPKWAIAWKYAAAEARSVLRSIEVGIGRTGRISLIGVIDPVFVAGATVNKATLHNPDFVTGQGLGIGSVVAVVRANDVIPRITAVIGEQTGVDAWVPPTVCPQCGEPWNKDSVLWRCLTPACSAVGALTYWCSRDALDIDRVGEAVCEALVNTGLAKDVADLYDITLDQWINLQVGVTAAGAPRLLGSANATVIMEELEASKQQPLARVYTGLGIRMTGRSVSRWLAKRFPSMELLRNATVDEVAEIDKMGPIKAQSVVAGIAKMAPIINRLAASGLTMEAELTEGEKPLAGKTYVVSGSVPGYTRTTIAERIDALGGTSSSSVSVRTTALVTSETDTSKAKKAAELGIPVIDPAEFAALIA